MNKRLTMMSVRQMRPLIVDLREQLRAAKQRIKNYEKRLDTCLVTEAGLRDRVAYLTAQLRKEGV